MALDSQQLAGFQMGDALLGGLIVLLLTEQLLAYLASYHLKPLRRGNDDRFAPPRRFAHALQFANR